MKNKLSLLLVLFTLIFSSCEKEFKIDIPASAKSVVVEGYIENGLPPYVYLSNTIDIFGKIDASTLNDLYVHNAKIIISDGTKNIQLKEYKFTFGASSFYIYTVDGLDFSGNSPITAYMPGIGPVGINPFVFNPADTGHLHTTYTLSIQLENETSPSVTSTTTIGDNIKLDSIWSVPSTTNDSLARVFVRIKENGSKKNYYRYFTRENNGRFLPGPNSVFDDQFTNGSTYTAPVDKGVDKTLSQEEQQRQGRSFLKGDTVTLKLTQIDQATYDFWNTLEYAAQNTGSPFAAPTNVKTNIVGGLGIWSGYAAYNVPRYQQYIIPK